VNCPVIPTGVHLSLHSLGEGDRCHPLLGQHLLPTQAVFSCTAQTAGWGSPLIDQGDSHLGLSECGILFKLSFYAVWCGSRSAAPCASCRSQASTRNVPVCKDGVKGRVLEGGYGKCCSTFGL